MDPLATFDVDIYAMSRIRCFHCHEKMEAFDALNCWCCEKQFCCDCISKSYECASVDQVDEEMFLCVACQKEVKNGD